MQRILVLTRDGEHLRSVEAAARPDGRVVRAEPSAEGALIAVRDWRPAVVVLDLSIGLTAGGVAALLRDEALAESTAVIAIATPSQLALIGPGTQVDDFVLSPVDDIELRLRLSRLIWERTGATDGSMIRHGALVIDLERYKVTVDSEVVDLTYKEYELLRFLASNPGKPFTREVLLNQVWGYDYYGGSRTVDVHIRRIRAKIESREQYIDTVRNVGYRFIEVFGAPPTSADNR
ncbi:MAG: response regulator transcription factor [Dehalococcoidia bacterium]|nr:MAG: response regulator transcription factor [Dehalococcoidia bacterium]